MNYEAGFNQFVLSLFIDFYDVKNNSKFAYKHVVGNQSSYTYSQQLIETIVNEIKKDPQHFVESLKRAKK